MAAFQVMHVPPAMCDQGKHDYQESVTTRQTDKQTDATQSDPYVLICFSSLATQKFSEIMSSECFLFTI